MSTPSHIIETIGIARITGCVGVGETAVMNARRKSLLPGRWYLPLKELCDAEGIECPASIFNWSRPEPDKAKAKAKKRRAAR